MTLPSGIDVIIEEVRIKKRLHEAADPYQGVCPMVIDQIPVNPVDDVKTAVQSQREHIVGR